MNRRRRKGPITRCYNGLVLEPFRELRKDSGRDSKSVRGAVLLEKLTVAHLVQKCSVFHRTRLVIAVSTRVVQSTPSHPVLLIPILTLSCHLSLRLPSGIFLWDFRTKTLDVFLITLHLCYISSPSHTPSVGHSNRIWRGVQITGLLVQFSPLCCHFVHLRSKYSSKNPVLK
jgi:hypothetical protein